MTQYICKVAVAGDGGIGKSSVITRLIFGKFISDYKMTIGTGINMYELSGKGNKISFVIWDFAGEERFRFILNDFVRGCSAILLCFDLTRYSTFKKLDEWYNLIINNCANPFIYLIGTKNDLKKKHSIKLIDVKAWSNNKQIRLFFKCSALTGENIKKIFKELFDDLIGGGDIPILPCNHLQSEKINT